MTRFRRYMGVTVFALTLMTSPARAQEDEVHFVKDRDGLISAQQYQMFNELYAFAQQQGKIKVYINLLKEGEELSRDSTQRSEQGRRFAETKKSIVEDLGDLVVKSRIDPAPTMPDLYLTVKPAALPLLLADDRVPQMVVFRNEFTGTLQSNMSPTSIAGDLGTSVATTHGDDGNGQYIVVIDTGSARIPRSRRSS